MLPAAPASLVGAAGQPLFGRYAGQAAGFDWSALAGPHARSVLWRRFHHKRWHYVALATEQVFCAVAIVDLGWISTCSGSASHRPDRDRLANYAQDGLPTPSARLAAHANGRSTFKMKNT